MNKTAIIWTNATWNCWSGCRKVSAGCKFCYAHTLAEQKRGTPAFPNGFDFTERKAHKFREPYRLKTPSLVFVNSMSDFFLKDAEFNLPDGTMDRLRLKAIAVMRDTPQHEYQVLTKRPDEMLRFCDRYELPGNFWAGVTLDTYGNRDRLDALRQVNAEVRFVSLEPMLSHMPDLDLTGIHWLIGGGESGNHLMRPEVRAKRGMAERDPKRKGPTWFPRPDRYHWAQDLRDLCKAQDVKFFWKQWGGVRPDSAGREIDGETWDEFPRLPGGLTDAYVGSDHRLHTSEEKRPEGIPLATG